MDYRLAEEWAAQDINVVSRADGIEAKSAYDVPSGHLAYIVVTANAVHFCVIGLLENTTNPFLRKPRLTGIHEQVRNVMDGFVGMVIVGVPAEGDGRLLEHVFERGHEAILAHQMDQAINIVRHKPSLLQRIPLGASLPESRFATPFQPLTAAVSGAHESDPRVVEVAVIVGACTEHLRIFTLSEIFGEAADAPIIISIVERPGNLIGHVPLFEIEVVIRTIRRGACAGRGLL